MGKYLAAVKNNRITSYCVLIYLFNSFFLCDIKELMNSQLIIRKGKL